MGLVLDEDMKRYENIDVRMMLMTRVIDLAYACQKVCRT